MIGFYEPKSTHGYNVGNEKLGLWRSRERVCMACRRSRVRIPSAPPRSEKPMKLLDSLHDEHDIEIFDMLLILYWDYDVAYEAQIGMD